MEQSTTPALTEMLSSGIGADQVLPADSRRTMVLAFGFLAAGVAFTMSWVGLLAYGMVQFAMQVFPGG